MPALHPHQLRDGAVAVAATAVSALGVDFSRFPAWDLVPVVASFVALLVQRRWPGITVAGLIAILAISAVQPQLTIGVIVVACIACYVTWRRLPTVARYGVTAVLFVGSASYIAFLAPALKAATWSQKVPYMGWVAVLILVFALIGMLRRRGEEHRRRELDWSLEQQRKEYELAAAHQREFIAQEIHDLVTHSLTGIVAQADAGR